MPVASASPTTPRGRKRPAEPTQPVFSTGLSPLEGQAIGQAAVACFILCPSRDEAKFLC
jgi:hypothetical protein